MLSTSRLAFRFLVLLLAGVGLGVGCDTHRNSTGEGTTATVARQTQTSASNTPSVAPLRDVWDVIYMQGQRVGHVHTTVTRETRGGQEALRVDCLNQLTIARGQQSTQQRIRCVSLETPDGKLLEFETEITMGTVPSKTVGKVEGGRLHLTTSTLGKVEKTTVEWRDEYGGPYALDLSLQRKPLQPGERRTLRHLAAGFNEPASVDIVAVQAEPVRLPAGTFELLRAEVTTRFSTGMVLPGTIWIDSTGEALKTAQPTMNMESYRATKELALDHKDLGKLDLLTTTSVRLPQPLVRPHQAQQIRYRAELEGGDPASVFVSGPSQQVRALDPHTALITVYGLRPGVTGNPDGKDTPPSDDDRQPNNSIQSDDPTIVAMAREAAGDEQDAWRTAVALERYVRGAMRQVDFSQAFATAAEVARSRVGDCTEHAVLLAALARARGIPSRVAVGLVYVESQQSFAYHMWTEVWIDGRWIALDGTLGQGGIGGGHLKLAHSNLKGSSQYLSFLPVIQVMGRLKLQAEPEAAK